MVAVVTVVATVLVGWQIFMIIDFRNYEKRISELKKDVDNQLKQIEHIRESYKGVSFRVFSELYSFLRLAMNGPEELCLFQQLSWMLEEIQSLFLIGNLPRLRNEYQRLCDIRESGFHFSDETGKDLRRHWDTLESRLIETPYYQNPDFHEIVDGISNQIAALTSNQ